MRRLGFYPKLAATGIRKNGNTYGPYLLTCICMIMMSYLMRYLGANPVIAGIKGGRSVQEMLGMGNGVFIIFSLIFLFYTNSFLIRRRKREFGLYNILGMGKWNLARILVWECILTTAVSLLGGLLLGILFSKASEMLLIHMLGGQITLAFSVDGLAAFRTTVLFLVIFALILLNNLRQIRMSNPIGLLHGTAEGEKPPKGNLLLAILGVVLLAGAYYIAVTIENPVSALMYFFAAVLMVILGTYLIFISGSVVLCRWLKKWKCYYYKPNHFISVSSMLYRMKRNGAGLASICILSTMVLVMISSSGCLYIGKENILRRQYPRDMQLAVWDGEEEHLDLLQSISEEYMQRHGFTMKDAWRYRYLSVAALADGDRLAFQRAGVSAGSLGDVSDLRNLLVIPLSDYNRATGKDETLPEGEILIGVNRGQEYPYETMKIGNLDTWKVKKTVPQPFDNKMASYEINTTYFVIVPDMDSVYQVEKEEKKVYGDYASDVCGYFGFNVDCSDEQQIKIEEGISLAISKKWMDMDIAYSTECIADDRSYFFGTFSGLFALGIILGSVFILAMILIMYYKQITEGYEDQSRFEVMQKVGMTKREIQRSINSQMLTVFILPPAMAGLHLTFAFPFLSKILMLFGLSDQSFLIRIAVGCFGVFTVFYILVYLFTSRAYYRIVSGN